MSNTSFKDHFSHLAASYATYRPSQPPALVDWAASLAPKHDRAWDCATGNGQAAVSLARHFDEVIATDASAAQIAQATLHGRVSYRVAPAEASGLPSASIDLVTVAQAAHWFDLDAFYAEVRRVVVPGGAVALWSYMSPRLGAPNVDAIFRRHMYEALGPYWPPERRLIEEGYRTFAFPFDEVAAPPFELVVSWTLPQLTGYMRTWSATAQYVAAHGRDPIQEFEAEVAAVWGDPARVMDVRWEYAVRAGFVNGGT